MPWLFFLHFYQPSTQEAGVLKQVVAQSYTPLIKLLKAHKNFKIIANIQASLADLLFNNGYHSLIDDIKSLVSSGQIELTESAAYHPLLTQLPEYEIIRQIRLNNQINSRIFGSVYHPSGFFPPEMAVDPHVIKIISTLGYRYILVDPSAIDLSSFQRGQSQVLAGSRFRPAVVQEPKKYLRTSSKNKIFPAEPKPGSLLAQSIFYAQGSDLFILPRSKELSLKLAFSQITTVKQLENWLAKNEQAYSPSVEIRQETEQKHNPFILTAMDAETFGHHRPEQIKFLKQLVLNHKKIKLKFMTVSDVLAQSNYLKNVRQVKILKSTWGEVARDRKGHLFWPHWNNSQNPVHRLQWQLYWLALSNLHSKAMRLSHPRPFIFTSQAQTGRGVSHRNSSRHLLDQGLQSDQFWWASHYPYWHPLMIKKGACLLRDSILVNPQASWFAKWRAKRLYTKIISTGKRLWGEGIVS